MSLNGFRAQIGTSTDGELYVDSERLSEWQGTVRLDEKVAQLFEQLRDPVYQYLVAVFGVPAEAEDITQDAFLQLYRTLHKGQAIGNVRCWIFRVAHNLAMNRKKHNQFLDPLDARSWEQMRDRLLDPSLNPEQRLLQQEKYERLQTALGRLSLQERQCLHLRAEGFRYREIAEILQISTSSVAEFLRRAIKKLTIQNNG